MRFRYVLCIILFFFRTVCALRVAPRKSEPSLSRLLGQRAWSSRRLAILPGKNVIGPVPPSKSDMTKAFLLLNGVAVIWGSQHALIKGALDDFPTSSLNFWRFASSALLFFPGLVRFVRRTDGGGKRALLYGGVELGHYTALGFAFQSVGLETTTASRSAFLLYLNVKFVPFLAAVLYRRNIPPTGWVSAALALTGTYLLSTDSNNSAFNVGDAWCIAAALASAFFILRLESISKEAVDAADELSSVSSLTVAILCGLWVAADLRESGAPFTSYLIDPFLDNPWPSLYLGAITTSLCGWLQIQGQRIIPAERASIIYSLDPLYGAAFSAYFLNEQFGEKGFAGGAFILAGVALSSLALKRTDQ